MHIASDALWLIGLAAVAFGIGLFSVPAGVIASGLGACFVGYALGKIEPQETDEREVE